MAKKSILTSLLAKLSAYFQDTKIFLSSMITVDGRMIIVDEEGVAKFEDDSIVPDGIYEMENGDILHVLEGKSELTTKATEDVVEEVKEEAVEDVAEDEVDLGKKEKVAAEDMPLEDEVIISENDALKKEIESLKETIDALVKENESLKSVKEELKKEYDVKMSKLMKPVEDKVVEKISMSSTGSFDESTNRVLESFKIRASKK
jgi:cell division protein FtsB